MAQIKLHEYIAGKLETCGRTQKEIAEEIGYTKPNIITMFKQNKTKVPIDKIKPFAIALGVDPVNMLRIAMTEYMPETWEAITGVVGNAVSANEMEIVKFIRRNIDETGSDPEMVTPVQQQLLKSFCESL